MASEDRKERSSKQQARDAAKTATDAAKTAKDAVAPVLNGAVDALGGVSVTSGLCRTCTSTVLVQYTASSERRWLMRFSGMALIRSYA
jgi:hypothetical protein